MMKTIFLGAILTMFLLQSCAEGPSCACVTATTEDLKKSRENGYKDFGGSMESSDCVEFTEEMSGKSEKERNAVLEEQKKCASYKELEKERALWNDYLKKQMEESMPSFD